MMRRRPMSLGGDTNDVSLQAAFNPWFYWPAIPLTYLAELSAGTLQRPLSEKETAQTAQYHQLAWTVINGVVMRLRYDFWDPDIEVIEDEIHRPGAGLDWTPFPGLTISADTRFGIPAGGEANGDAFIQLHGWF
jgi:hypothetical protein